MKSPQINEFTDQGITFVITGSGEPILKFIIGTAGDEILALGQTLVIVTEKSTFALAPPELPITYNLYYFTFDLSVVYIFKV